MVIVCHFSLRLMQFAGIGRWNLLEFSSFDLTLSLDFQVVGIEWILLKSKTLAENQVNST